MFKGNLNYRQLFLLACLIAVLLLSIILIGPYLITIIFAILAAHFWQPVVNKTRKVIGDKLSNFVSFILFTLLIILPATLIVALIATQISTIVADIDLPDAEGVFQTISSSANSVLTTLPIQVDTVSPQEIKSATRNALTSLPQLVLPVSNFLISSVTHTILFLIVFGSVSQKYEQFINYIIKVSPLDEKHTQDYLEAIWNISKQVFKGTVLVGIIQGIIALIAFLILQVEYSFFWAVLTTITAILPVGAGFILFPLGLFYILTGEAVKGVIILALGFILVNLVDNILRPRLAAQNSVLPQAVILIGILGGLYMFGIAGVLIGPLVLTVTKVSLDMASKH